jgi:hypothetical protein
MLYFVTNILYDYENKVIKSPTGMFGVHFCHTSPLGKKLKSRLREGRSDY